MPRRRPSALRGEISVRRQHRQRYASIDRLSGDRLSGSCTGAIRRLERTRFPPESTAEAFQQRKLLAHGPLRPFTKYSPENGGCSFVCDCQPALSRDHLEEVLHALPGKGARELRALVRSLDRTILTRATVIRADAPDVPRWRGRFCQSS